MRIVNLANLEPFQAVNLLSDPGHVPGPVIVPNCAQIVLGWILEDGKVGHNVLYGRYAGSFSGTVAQCNAILSALGSGAAWTALAAFLPTTTALGQVTIRDVNTAQNPILANSTSGPSGTSVSPAVPNEVSAVITLRTAKTGQQNRGRAYIPGWATNALGAGNIIAAAAVTALNNWAATIPTALSGQGYTWVLGQPHRAAYTSPVTGRQFPERLATSTPITSQVVRDNHWDTQRRRGLK